MDGNRAILVALFLLNADGGAGTMKNPKAGERVAKYDKHDSRSTGKIMTVLGDGLLIAAKRIQTISFSLPEDPRTTAEGE